jgi:hypothetical protein
MKQSNSWKTESLSAGQKSLPFTKRQDSLPTLQEPATGSNPESLESSAHRHAYFFTVHFYVFPSTPWSSKSKWYLSFVINANEMHQR